MSSITLYSVFGYDLTSMVLRVSIRNIKLATAFELVVGHSLESCTRWDQVSVPELADGDDISRLDDKHKPEADIL